VSDQRIRPYFTLWRPKDAHASFLPLKTKSYARLHIEPELSLNYPLLLRDSWLSTSSISSARSARFLR
jgi:hypothetical protein